MCKGETMRKFWSQAVACTLVIGLGATLAGCGKVREFQARMKIRDAHQLYKGQEWPRAAQKYEETLALEPSTSDYAAYFFLGNSYDNMYSPNKKGDPTNDGFLNKAVENYKKAAELQTDRKMKNLAL